MAEKMSLLSLEDDLTCSICLCVFDNPVSLICGHSFCANCLEAAWSDKSSTLFCPHCRMQFSSKPELRKNTVLGAVLEAYKGNSGISESEPMKTPVEVIKNEPEPIKCDSCMEAPAVKTCLTCMASYCEDHVRPHRENAIFRAHQLSDPLSDLLERLCPDHSKLMEFFCSKHGCCICSNCLHFGHKGCEFTSTDDQRFKQKTNLNGMLNTLEVKIDKNQQVVAQMKEQQIKLKGLAATRKHILETEYRQIRQMIDRDENEAMHAIDEELIKGQSKLASMMKKFNENVEKMSSTKSEINSLLDQSQSLTFLKACVNLPSVVNFEPYNPRINVDSNKVISYHSSAVALKEWITRLLEQPAENRILVLKPAQFSENRESFTALPNPREMFSQPHTHVRSPSPGAPLRGRVQGTKQKNQPNKSRATKEKNDKPRKDQSANRTKNNPREMNPSLSKSMENITDMMTAKLKMCEIGMFLFSHAFLYSFSFLCEVCKNTMYTDEPKHYDRQPNMPLVCHMLRKQHQTAEAIIVAVHTDAEALCFSYRSFLLVILSFVFSLVKANNHSHQELFQIGMDCTKYYFISETIPEDILRPPVLRWIPRWCRERKQKWGKCAGLLTWLRDNKNLFLASSLTNKMDELRLSTATQRKIKDLLYSDS